MKSIRSVWLAIASLSAVSSYTPTLSAASFDDIQFWVGSGENRAALVIDWNDGKSSESLVWGYRWDGTANGLDMLQAVISADPRLYGHFGSYVWGTAIQGLGYDLNGNGFSVSPSLTFDAGGLAFTTSPDDLRTASDAADHYIEGWDYGFWAYYNKSSADEAWTSALIGAEFRALSDGVWDGYSFAPEFSGPEPGEPFAAPIPEPTIFAMTFLGAGIVLFRRVRANRD
jgi:PEP-CTERM putative exosortase interaction domain